MNKIKRMLISFLVLFGTTVYGHGNKTSPVMEEMIKLHAALVKETSGKLDTKQLIKLLSKGADNKKDKAIFTKAIPLAEKLSNAVTLQDKKNAYSSLVEGLVPIVGQHDKSNANLFYCPMAKKKWIARGEQVVNPYLKDMRDCGEKK